MKGYVSNLLPRLKEYSKSLDKIELIVEQPWVVIDENFNQQKYIFKRNGELIMSYNGEVTIGNWEYISSAKSLLIDRKTDKILLNQNFVNHAIMVLSKDGLTNENLILANETIIPDLDVENYVRRLFYKKHNIKLGTMKNGDVYEFHFGNSNRLQPGLVITTDGGLSVPDKKLYLKNDKKILIKESRIVQVYETEIVDTNRGLFYIEVFKYFPNGSLNYNKFQKGNKVYDMAGNFAPDGKYKTGLFKSFMVENGVIIS